MATSAVWAPFVTDSQEPWFRQIPRGLRWPVCSVVLISAGLLVTAVAARHGWLHIVLEFSAISLVISTGAMLTIAASTRHHRQFVETMAKALDARDTYTAGHSTRVGSYACATARALGFSKRAARTMFEAAQLHDIGKIGVPDAVLQKKEPLTADEFALIRLHPQIGRKILERTGQFKKFLPVVELHHENWDGSGYPYGLRAEQIPLEARIVRVADAFDAMTSGRCYRPAPTQEWAIEEMRRCSGTHFDPRVTTVFLTLLAHGVFEPTLSSASLDYGVALEFGLDESITAWNNGPGNWQQPGFGRSISWRRRKERRPLNTLNLNTLNQDAFLPQEQAPEADFARSR